MSIPSALSPTDGGAAERANLAPGVALAAVLLIAAAVRLFRLDALSFWLDETATLELAHGNFFEIWGRDTHPPLYYSLIALWRQLGESAYVLRLSSVIPSVATVWVVWLCGRAIADRRTATIAALLQAVAPFAIGYAQDLRMYPLLELYAAMALLGLLRLLRDPEAVAAVPLFGPASHPLSAASLRWAWLLYGLGTVLVLYGHNMGFLWPLVANAVTIVVWARRPDRRPLLRRWFAVNLSVLALWLPWIPTMLKQVGGVIEVFWVQQVDLFSMLGLLADLDHALGPDLTDAAIFLVAGLWVLCLWGALLLRPRALTALLVTAVIVPPLIAWALGWVVRPIFLTRTLIWTAIPCLLGTARAIAWCLERRQAAWLAAGAALLCLVLGIRVSGIVHYFSEHGYPDWRGLMQTLAWEMKSSDKVAVVPGYHTQTFEQYALRQAREGRPSPPDAHGAYGAKDIIELTRDLAPGERHWFVLILGDENKLKVPLAELLRLEVPCVTAAQRVAVQGLEATLIVAGDDCTGAS